MRLFKRKRKEVCDNSIIIEEKIGIEHYYINPSIDVEIDIPETTDYLYYDMINMYIRLLTNEIVSDFNNTDDLSQRDDELCDMVYQNVINALKSNEENNYDSIGARHKLEKIKELQEYVEEEPTIHFKCKMENPYANDLEKVKEELLKKKVFNEQKKLIEKQNKIIIDKNKELLNEKLQLDYFHKESKLDKTMKISSINQKNNELEKLKLKALKKSQRDEKKLKKIKGEIA